MYAALIVGWVLTVTGFVMVVCGIMDIETNSKNNNQNLGACFIVVIGGLMLIGGIKILGIF